MSQFSYRVHAAYLQSPLSLFSCSKEVETWVGHSSVILTLHVGHSRYNYWFVNLWLSPSTLYNLAEYLMLDDGECLNALLPADFIPSTSDHLFWDWNLESFFSALRLAVISGRFSHHRQSLGIYQCPLIDGFSQVFDLNTFIHTC